MKADKYFPVTVGTTVTLSCIPGYELKGDKTVTCTKETDFTFSEEPECGEYLLNDHKLRRMMSVTISITAIQSSVTLIFQ